MCEGETQCACNLNNDKIVVFVVIDAAVVVVVMATHTTGVP